MLMHDSRVETGWISDQDSGQDTAERLLWCPIEHLAKQMKHDHPSSIIEGVAMRQGTGKKSAIAGFTILMAGVVTAGAVMAQMQRTTISGNVTRIWEDGFQLTSEKQLCP